ncbi:ankyrin repeat-containing domain protein [Xylariales sp. PMI_506]|nr:ankyrin repeat-containing domain protein [Xylariales sp. PMI_506]
MSTGVGTSLEQLLAAAKVGNEAEARQLLQNGAEVNSKSSFGDQTPLSCAAQNGHTAIVRLLLEHNADVNLEVERRIGHDEGELITPLCLAIEKGHEAIMRLLLEKGGNINHESINKLKLLQHAAWGGQEAIVRFFLFEQNVKVDWSSSYGRQLFLQATRGGHVAVVRLMLDLGADGTLWEPIISAAGQGDEKMVRLLLESGADVNAKSQDSIHASQTPLFYAVRNGHEATVRLLLEKGANVEAQEFYRNRTPLLFAIEAGNSAIVRLLVENGANVNARELDSEQTPLSLAMQYDQREDIVQILTEAGAKLKFSDDSTWSTGWSQIKTWYAKASGAIYR